MRNEELGMGNEEWGMRNEEFDDLPDARVREFNVRGRRVMDILHFKNIDAAFACIFNLSY